MPIKVILVDDHAIVRDGLKSLLARESDIEVVGEAENGPEALKAIRSRKPDVVVMDISMPGLSGIDVTRKIGADYPDVLVLALSMHSDSRHIAEMLAAGAKGYLLKDCAFDELATAIHAVSEGRTFLSPAASQVVVGDYVRQVADSGKNAAEPQTKPLSPREREVLALICAGPSTKEIAARLNLSPKTVETHRRQIMEKLGIYSVAGLTKYALREGLASLDD